MSELDEGALRWAAAALGAPVATASGLRDGGAPWLIETSAGRGVLRIGGDDLALERRGLEFASAQGIPVSRVLAAALEHDPPLLLIEAVDGSSAVPRAAPVARLRALGRHAARLHAIDASAAGLPRRERSISGVDFDVLRAAAPPQPLLAQAEVVARERRPANPDGFVHGDLWQGNVLWRADEVAAIIDWDCCGVGPAGIDLGSLRCDAATAFGVDAAAHVLAGWTAEAGRPADDVAYWDVVAALCTPPDLGWFRDAIAGQGRDDLTVEVMIERRDTFLAAALDRLS